MCNGIKRNAVICRGKKEKERKITKRLWGPVSLLLALEGKNKNATREAASCCMWHLNRWLAKGAGAERNRSLDEKSRQIITLVPVYRRLTGANKLQYFHWSEFFFFFFKDCNINNFMFSGWAHFIAAEAEVQFAMTELSNDRALIPRSKIWSQPISFFWTVILLYNAKNALHTEQHINNAINAACGRQICNQEHFACSHTDMTTMSLSFSKVSGGVHKFTVQRRLLPSREWRKKTTLHRMKRTLMISLPEDITLLKSVEKAVASVLSSTWEQERQARAVPEMERKKRKEPEFLPELKKKYA